MPPIPHEEGGPGTASPTRLTYRNLTMWHLLMRAYGVEPYQLSGPAWAVELRFPPTEAFELAATLPPGATKEQLAIMLQNALADRFHLKVHRENKTTQGYALTVGKQGPKLTRSPESVAPTEAEAGPRPYVLGKDGFPTEPPSYSGLLVDAKPDRIRLKFARTSMADLAKWLGKNRKSPVIDRTGLEGQYDFIFEFQNGGPSTVDAGDTAPAGDGGAPSLFYALESVLALKLVRETCPIEMLVIDHVDHMPTAN
jgi:uncharacterized protein (TIGR03435 family)